MPSNCSLITIHADDAKPPGLTERRVHDQHVVLHAPGQRRDVMKEQESVADIERGNCKEPWKGPACLVVSLGLMRAVDNLERDPRLGRPANRLHDGYQAN